MNVIQQTTPILALISRRQCTQAYKSRSLQSSLHLFNSYSTSSKQLSRVTRRNASTNAARKSRTVEPQQAIESIVVDEKATYNSPAGLDATKKADGSTTIAQSASPSSAAGYDENASATSRTLAPTQSSPPYILDPHVNPPSTTRPPTLELPVRQPAQTTIGYYIKLGRAYLTFYKHGLQSINAARKAANLIRARTKKHEKAHLALMKSDPEKVKQQMATAPPPWTRAEFQLLRRSRHDMSRVPIFGLMFLVFGEFLPLVMLVAKSRITPLLPYTVRLPSQVDAIRTTIVERRLAVEKKWDESNVDKDDSIDTFALYGAEYFNLGPWFLPLAWQPKYVVLRHTRVYYEYLLYDDVMLGKDGVKKLMDEEVAISCLERGLWDQTASVNELRERLHKSVRRSLQPVDKKRSIYERETK